LLISPEFTDRRKTFTKKHSTDISQYQNQTNSNQNNAHNNNHNNNNNTNLNISQTDIDSSGYTTTGSQSDYEPNPRVNKPQQPQYSQYNHNHHTNYPPPTQYSPYNPTHSYTTSNYSSHTPSSPFDQFSLQKIPQKRKLPPAVISFVDQGTTEFEIFLDCQLQQIEKKREHYLNLAKEVAKSFGHTEDQCELFNISPTYEIIKYLDYHGELVDELCQLPPEQLPISFYYPNADGTIPSSYYNETLSPLLLTKIIEPEQPKELIEAKTKADDYMKRLEENLDEAKRRMENPEKYWLVNESNWEDAINEIFDSIGEDPSEMKSKIKSLFRQEELEESFSNFIAKRAKKIDLFKVVKVLDPTSPTGYDYEMVTHPYVHHPAVRPLIHHDDIIEGDLDIRDMEGSEKKADKLMQNLDKLISGEVTHDQYIPSDPFFELYDLTHERSVIDEQWIETTLELQQNHGDLLSSPMLQTPEFGYGTFTPSSMDKLIKEVKTNPYFREHFPHLDDVLALHQRREDGWADDFPNLSKQRDFDEEYRTKMWVDLDQDYIDKTINVITPQNEEYFRDYTGEENQRRLHSMKARQELEDYVARDHPHMYRQWLKFLYNEYLGLHFGEAMRDVYEEDPRDNRTYGDEVKQIEEMYNKQFQYENQLYGDSITLFRPPDGNLNGTEDDPRWKEYLEFDLETGESLCDENGVLLTAGDYKKKRELEEQEKFEKIKAKELKLEEIEKRKKERQIEREERKKQRQTRSFFSHWFGTGQEIPPNDEDLDLLDALDEKAEAEKEEAETDWDPFSFNPTPLQRLQRDGQGISTMSNFKPSSYARVENKDVDSKALNEHRRRLDQQREILHQQRLKDAKYSQDQFIGQDEFDLLMTTADFNTPKKKPLPKVLHMPDLHIDTIRRKVAIINGDIEEDEEDDPDAARKEWADPVRSEEIPKSRRYKDVMKYSYEQLDQDYIRKKEKSEKKFGGGLESLEYLHLIGDRYDRREENLLQRIDKTTAKFRQFDQNVVKLKKMREELIEFQEKEPERINSSDLSQDDYHEAVLNYNNEVKKRHREVEKLQLDLKERFQDEELEYSRSEWGGIKDKIDFLGEKHKKDPSYQIKKLRRQQLMHIDYENNPIEGENFRDAYIQERIELERKRVQQDIDSAFEHHPSLLDTIHIKDRADLMKLTRLLYRQFAGDTAQIREAILKLPIRFYMQDVKPAIDKTLQTGFLHGKEAAGFDSYGAVDRQLLDTILDGMNNDTVNSLGDDAKNAKEYDQISKILESQLLPSTLQARVDQLADSQQKIQLFGEANKMLKDGQSLPGLTPTQLRTASKDELKNIQHLQSQVKLYQDDVLGLGGKEVLDSYNLFYQSEQNQNNKQKKDTKKFPKQQKTKNDFLQEYEELTSKVPAYQVVTPSQSTPWKRWMNTLEDDGYIPVGEDDIDTRRELMKRDLTRLFPDFANEPLPSSSPPEPNLMDQIIDPRAPEALRGQAAHEVKQIKDRYGYDILKDEMHIESVEGDLITRKNGFDLFHPRHELKWFKIPTARRVFGKGRKGYQNELDYQQFLRHKLPEHRLHNKGGVYERMMLPRPDDWIHYEGKTVDEVRDMIWNEEDLGAKRIRETPHLVWKVTKSKNEKLYDFLGELKRQMAPKSANDPDFISKMSPLNEDEVKYFYDESELGIHDVVPTNFPQHNQQLRPKHSHLEDEIESFRREKIDDYYRQRSDSNMNYFTEGRQKKDKKLFQKQAEFQSKVRRNQFNERALELGSFGLDVDPDDLDRNEAIKAIQNPHAYANQFFDSKSTLDDPTRFLRRSHPDINSSDYETWQYEGPQDSGHPSGIGPSIFSQVPDSKPKSKNDLVFDTPFEYKDKSGKVILKDDPLEEIKIPGVDLKRYDPAFKEDIKRFTKEDYSEQDKENSNDNVYERYRDQHFDRWRANLLEQGHISEQLNLPTPKLPQATYLVKKQAVEDDADRALEQWKLHKKMQSMDNAWKLGQLNTTETEDYRRLFHGTGEPKIWHHHAIPFKNEKNDYNQEEYYQPANTYQDMPTEKFMAQNPQFMKPQHEYHKAKPLHSAHPRPIPWDPDNTLNRPDFIRNEDPVTRERKSRRDRVVRGGPMPRRPHPNDISKHAEEQLPIDIDGGYEADDDAW
jgi:hypothetical protein